MHKDHLWTGVPRNESDFQETDETLRVIGESPGGYGLGISEIREKIIKRSSIVFPEIIWP